MSGCVEMTEHATRDSLSYSQSAYFGDKTRGILHLLGMAAPSTSLGSGSRFKPKARINSEASSLLNFGFVVNMAESLEGVIDGGSRGKRGSFAKLGHPSLSCHE